MNTIFIIRNKQKVKVAIGQAVELTNNKQILLSKEDGGRVIIVQIANK